MSKIETKFDLHQKVGMIELHPLLGTIVGIRINIKGVEYEVQYFYHGEPKVAWLLEQDLCQ